MKRGRVTILLPAPQSGKDMTPQTYDIPVILKVTAIDEQRALHVAEGIIAAAKRFNGTELEIVEQPVELEATA